MNFTFENQGTNTYLVYTVKPEDTIDTMSLGMLTNNKISGLASTVFTQMDTTKYIKYNVSAKISVKQFFTGPVNKKRLVGVFKGIVNAMLSAEEYMLDTSSIILNLDYIFADVSTCETVLICLPIAEVEQNNMDLGVFFKNIVFSTQFDQTENCDYVAKIINYLNSSPVFSLNDFKGILESVDSSNPVGNAMPQNVQPVVQNVQTFTQTKTPAQQLTPAQQPKVQASAPTPQPQVVNKAPVPNNNSKKTIHPANKVQVPNQKPMAGQPTATTTGAEKQISFFYLMQHYNKENAALYKAQKEAKKAGGNVPPQGVQQPQAGMAIPRQQAPNPAANFAIPGQQVSNPAGFAIPGQPTPPPQAAPRQGMQQPNSQPKAAPVPQPMQMPQQAPQQMRPASTPVQPAPMQQQPPVQPAPQPTYQPQAVPQAQPMNFGETTVLGGSKIGETTVLGMATNVSQVNPHLIRSKTGEKILLNKPVFRIGKEKSYVDYFIGDNTAISRSHANVISRDGGYFVVDTNSTNHTYVNGVMLQSNVELKIANGDKVKLANEEFEFRLY